jgi:hypothetical protein
MKKTAQRLLILTALAMAVCSSRLDGADDAAERPAQPLPVTPLFIVHFTLGPNWDHAKAASEQTGFAGHSANLARLRRDGVLVLGARYADKGMIILRVADEDAARAALEPDTTLGAGVFVATIDEFRPFYHGNTRPSE